MDNNKNIFEEFSNERESLFAGANEKVAIIEEKKRQEEERKRKQEEERKRIQRENTVALGNEVGGLIIHILKDINRNGLKSSSYNSNFVGTNFLKDYNISYELDDNNLNIILEYDWQVEDGFPKKGLSESSFDAEYLGEYLNQYNIEITCTNREWTSIVGRIDVKCKSKTKEKNR